MGLFDTYEFVEAPKVAPGAGAPGAGATAVSPGDGSGQKTNVYVTVGAAFAAAVGGLVLGTLVGWAWRGAHEKEKRIGSEERRKLHAQGRR